MTEDEIAKIEALYKGSYLEGTIGKLIAEVRRLQALCNELAARWNGEQSAAQRRLAELEAAIVEWHEARHTLDYERNEDRRIATTIMALEAIARAEIARRG